MNTNKEKGATINLITESTPILYTDHIFMITNEDGVTLEIGQKVIASDQIKIVSRIGMSRTHAKKIVAELGKLLAMTEGALQTGEKRKN